MNDLMNSVWAYDVLTIGNILYMFEALFSTGFVNVEKLNGEALHVKVKLILEVIVLCVVLSFLTKVVYNSGPGYMYFLGFILSIVSYNMPFVILSLYRRKIVMKDFIPFSITSFIIVFLTGVASSWITNVLFGGFSKAQNFELAMFSYSIIMSIITLSIAYYVNSKLYKDEKTLVDIIMSGVKKLKKS